MSKKLNMLSAAYTKLINGLNVQVEDNSELLQNINGVTKYVTVEGKPLLIPTVDNTRDYREDVVLFHPMSENVLLGESPVIKETRALMMDCLHSLILETVNAMLKIGVDNDLVSSLTPSQIELLRCTSGVDATTIKNWKSIMRRAESRGSANRVVTIFLKRGAELNDVDYKRAAIVNFNIYNELIDGKLSLFGVKIRKADATIFIKTLETIIEDIAIIDKYSKGSNSLVAPYFDALVQSYSKILKTINKVTWNLRKPIKEVLGFDLHIKDEFTELFADLIPYRDIIPALPYNDGDRNDKRDKTQKETAVAPTPIPEHQLPGVSKLGETNNQYYAPNLQTVAPPVQQTPPQQPAQPQQTAPHVSQALPSIEEQLYGQVQSPVVAPVNWQQGYNQVPPMWGNGYMPNMPVQGFVNQQYGYQPNVPVQGYNQQSQNSGNYGAWASQPVQPQLPRW